METLKKIATWKVILLLALYLTFSLGVFPYYQAQVDDLAGEKIKALDLRLTYSLADVEASFRKMGPEGRVITRFISSRVDAIYLLVYGLFLVLLIIFLVKGFRPKILSYLWVLPVIGVLFDYLENRRVIQLLDEFPSITEEQVSASAMMTGFKWFFILAALAIVLVLAVLKFANFIRQRRAK